CGAHRIDDCDMEIAVIPPDDSGTVFLPKIDLPLTDHLDSPSPRRRPVLDGFRRAVSDISVIYHAQAPGSIGSRGWGNALNDAPNGRVPLRLFRPARKNNLTAFNDIEPVGKIGNVVDVGFGNEYGMTKSSYFREPFNNRRNDHRR